MNNRDSIWLLTQQNPTQIPTTSANVETWNQHLKYMGVNQLMQELKKIITKYESPFEFGLIFFLLWTT
jgi:hypothetical protein